MKALTAQERKQLEALHRKAVDLCKRIEARTGVSFMTDGTPQYYLADAYISLNEALNCAGTQKQGDA